MMNTTPTSKSERFHGMNVVGGNYQNLETQGVTTAQSALVVGETWRSQGTFKGTEVSARQIDLQGEATVTSLQAETLRQNGRLRGKVVRSGIVLGEGGIRAEELSIEKIEFKGEIIAALKCTFTTGETRGTIESPSISAGTFNHHGSVISAELTAERFIMKMDEASRSSIRILSARSIEVSGVGDKRPLIVAERIEGEDIRLAWAQVQRVSGQNVEIGPGCICEEVHYRGTLQVDPGSTVKKSTKIS